MPRRTTHFMANSALKAKGARITHTRSKRIVIILIQYTVGSVRRGGLIQCADEE